MKRLLTLALLVLAVATTQAQPKPIVVDLWPNGAPKENGLTGPEQPLENGRVANISRATLYVYPSPTPNAPAIISCPGGGYRRLAMNHEGHDMATWLFPRQTFTQNFNRSVICFSTDFILRKIMFITYILSARARL